jgi:hypothetical protein
VEELEPVWVCCGLRTRRLYVEENTVNQNVYMDSDCTNICMLDEFIVHYYTLCNFYSQTIKPHLLSGSIGKSLLLSNHWWLVDGAVLQIHGSYLR